MLWRFAIGALSRRDATEIEEHIQSCHVFSEIFSCEAKQEIEIGRQKASEGAAPGDIDKVGLNRLVIAPLHFRGMSRRHLLVTPITYTTARATSLTNKGDILINGKDRLAPSQRCEVPFPAEFFLGQHTLRLQLVARRD
jgi:hypothetical protein